MEISTAVALVTGANRGIGARIVDELVRRGAPRIYAGVRDPYAYRPADDRVVPVAVDITSDRALARAAEVAGDVTLLINNAGVLTAGSVLTADWAGVERDLAVNYLGTLRAIRAFVPVLERNGGGAVVNVLTMIALAPMVGLATYSASKAAADNLTRSLRAELAGRGITVHGVYPAGVDTDMLAGFDGVPKANPAEVARLIVGGLAADAEDIAPDPVSAQGYQVWSGDPKAFERSLNAPAGA